MSDALRFDGKVVIITGAGAGLGRSHALMFGARGASVVVNDLGGSTSGGGQSNTAADKVVDEIRALGGQAVANYDSVEDGDKIVKTALDAFGTVDVVVNNAGILRDVSFQKMSAQDWDLILRVHLSGSKSVTQAAWPILREKGYGRIIMTTSAAGLYGNFGQANYCAAKLGLLGLAQCLAEEGRAKNILVNTIAPIAASRLTETVMPPELLAKLDPKYISPLVGWLCHESCNETKGLFEVGAGYFSKLRWERTRGYAFPAGRTFEVEDLAARWNKVTDFADAEHPSSTNDTFTALMSALNAKKLGGNEFIDLDVAMNQELVLESRYDERDLALYALGVGAARDPLDDSERRFVYELGKFHPLPTWGVMPQSSAMLAAARDGKLSLPGMSFGLDRLLHGEQYLELKRPLPKQAKLRHVFKAKAAYDKNPNTVVVWGISSIDEQGEEIAYNEMTAFVKGAGGWGGERGPSADINLPPDRAPDAVIEECTDPNQTLLYRLSGDWNPLHADPEFARAFGYDRPILHGLCTFGHVGRHVVKAFLDNDPRKFKSIKVRFAGAVFPGETLVTRMWKESDTRVIVETRVKERDVVVIKNAAVELHAQIPKLEPKPQAVAQVADAAPAQDQRVLPEDIFGVIGAFIAANPEVAAKTKTSFQFNLSNPESQWVLDLKNGQGEARPGTIERPDVTVDLDQDLLLTCISASLPEVQKLFFGGQLKIGGNVMASNKLTVLQGIDRQRYEEARAQRVGASPQASPATAAAAPAKAGKPSLFGNAAGDAAASAAKKPVQPQAPAIFKALAERLAKQPAAANGAKGQVLQFTLRDPDASWIVDLRGDVAKVEPGKSADAGAVFGLADADLLRLVKGEAQVQDLFQRGRLQVDGDVRLAHELGFLDRLI